MLTLDALAILFHYYNGCRGHKYVTLYSFIEYHKHNNMSTANNAQIGETILYKLDDVMQFLDEEG